MKEDEAIKLILAMDDGEWLSAFDEVGLYHYSDTLSNILSEREQPEWRIFALLDYMLLCIKQRD